MKFLKERCNFKRGKTNHFKYTIILMDSNTYDYDVLIYNYDKTKQ